MAVMRAIIALLLLTAVASAQQLDPTILLAPGDYTERFVVPELPPPSGGFIHGLQYTIKHEVPTCLRYEDIWAKRENGTPLAVTIEETGTPGAPGYELNAYVDDSGVMLFHVRVVDICPKVG